MLKVTQIKSFQIILCKTDIAPKGIFLVQAGLKQAFQAENRELELWHFKSKKQNNTIIQCRIHFLTSDEMPSKKYFFGLSLILMKVTKQKLLALHYMTLLPLMRLLLILSRILLSIVLKLSHCALDIFLYTSEGLDYVLGN